MIFTPMHVAELVQGLLALWPKFLPYVVSFGVLGLRWLSNIEVRTRAEFVNREYVNWWLLYLLLITCVPFTTIVVGRFRAFRAGDLALCRPYASDRAGQSSPDLDHSAIGARRHLSFGNFRGFC